MATTTYTADRTALLIVDPYNDFMSEGGSSTRRRGRRPKRSAFTTTCASWIPGMRPLHSMRKACTRRTRSMDRALRMLC